MLPLGQRTDAARERPFGRTDAARAASYWSYWSFNEQSTSATPVGCPWTQRLDGHRCGSRRASRDPNRRMRPSVSASTTIHRTSSSSTSSAASLGYHSYSQVDIPGSRYRSCNFGASILGRHISVESRLGLTKFVRLNRREKLGESKSTAPNS